MTDKELAVLLGKNIAALRKTSALPIEFLAERLGTTPEALQKIEQGEVLTDIIILMKVSDVFDVDISYLLSDTMESDMYSKNTYEKLLHILQTMDKDNLELIYKFAMFIRRLKEDRDLSDIFTVL